MYDFHDYFDGIIGHDILSNNNILIDFKNNQLIRGDKIVKISFKPLTKHYVFEFEQAGTFKIKIPVDIENGDVLIEDETVNGISIIGGLYVAKNWETEIMIESKANKKLTIVQPLKSVEFNHIEINNLSISDNTDSDLTRLIRTDHLNNEERKHLLKLINNYSDVIHREGQDLSFTNHVKHNITTTDEMPVYSKTYRYPYVHKEEIKNQIDKMLEQKIIRPSFSPWSSPIWVVPKKLDASNTQKWRLVVDYRKLNEKTIDDRYPLPNITEILDKIGRCLYFTTLDLASGFHQIEVNEKDIPKTAFTVENGHYEYTRMPFGLKNAPSTFQRVMDEILKDLQNKICLVYMDDIIIYSTSLAEHMQNLTKVLDALRRANLKIQLDKSEFLRREVAFLGHIVTSDGIKPNPSKISAVKNYPIPKSQKEIKQFLGLLGYYRRFIKDFARLTKPLTAKLKKDEKINVNDDSYKKCFEICKQMLIDEPILQYPNFSKQFILTTDASNFALGAVLSQIIDGREHPICYASRTLNEHEVNYSTIEKELLAIVWGTKYFRPYLYGRKFKIQTDHKPLNWLMSLKEPNSKLVRWRLKLEEFDYDIEYKAGKINSNADALSRIPIKVNTSELESSGATCHSAESDNQYLIPISQSALNVFKYQHVFKKITSGAASIKTIKPFGNVRKTISLKEFNEDNIVQIIKTHFNPKQVNAIHVNDKSSFLIIQDVYKKHFARNKLFRVVKCSQLNSDITNDFEQDEVIKNYHNDNNHRGINETLEHLKRSYFFPNMKNKITLFINQCEICQKEKYDRNPTKIKFNETATPKQPLEICHVDIFFFKKGIPILTIIDKFSRYAQAFVLQSRNTPHIKKKLMRYFSLFGKPKLIITDQERACTTVELKEYLASNNVKIHFSSVNSSNSNAPVERFHSTLLEHLRIILNNEDIELKNALYKALQTYNNSINNITKFTPFELFFGRKINDTLESNIKKIEEKRIEMQAQAYINSKNKKNKYITDRNQNREEPNNLPENVYLKLKNKNKLESRNKKFTIQRQKRVNVYDRDDIKHHKKNILRPRKISLQGGHSNNMPHRHSRPNDEPGTDDDSD